MDDQERRRKKAENDRRYRIKNAESLKKRKAEYFQKNKTKIYPVIQKWRAKNKDKALEYSKKWENKNLDKVRVRKIRWHHKHNIKEIAKMRKNREELKDVYIKSILNARGWLITKNSIEIKRVQILIHRSLKKQK